ncbi:MAG: hypothetical protein H0V26_00485 [Solirubrobacterales bacterium]|nr:hypothetical protein [Solirubrobacterales bacterium]
MTTLLGFIEEIRHHAGPEVIPPGTQIETKISPDGVPFVAIDGAFWIMIDDTAVRTIWRPGSALISQFRDGVLVAERVEGIDYEREDEQ